MKRSSGNRKRRLFVKLFCLMMALLLCSCEGKKTSEEPETSGVTADYKTVLEEIAGYTIILPERATAAERSAMQILHDALGEDAKRPQSDFVKRGEDIPKNNFEILIGKTNRASSGDAIGKLERDRDFTIAFEQNEVIIAANSDKAIIDAVNYFIQSVLPAKASEHTPGFSQTVLYDYPLDRFFGLSTAYLKIGYTDPSLASASEMLWNYINDSTGVHAETDTAGGGNIRLVIDPDLTDCDYKVEPINGTLVLSAISPFAMCEAISDMTDEGRGSETLSYTGKGEIPLSMLSIQDGRKMMLVWGDEFNGDALDASNWKLEDRMWNREHVDTSDHSEKHIKVEDGSLVMNTYRIGDEDRYSTHGTLTTKDIMTFQYGYLEIRARLPYDEGAWPAFWMQSAEETRTVDYMTEIDVFELYKDDYMEGTMHKWYLNENGAAEKHDWNDPKVINFSTALESFDRETFSREYHLYGFGWTPTNIYFTVDGKIVGIYDITDAGDFGAGLGNVGEAGRLTGMGGFHDPVFVNFTNWVNTTGAYKGSWKVGEDSEFPFTYCIDYIRLYQVPGEGMLNTMGN